MNSIATSLPMPAHSPSQNSAAVSSACFHCGLTVPATADFQIPFDGTMRPLCCAGCEAVARTILDAGLDAYYRNRSGAPLAPPSLDDDVRTRLDALFAIDKVQAEYVAAPDALTRKADLYVDGITCAACVWLAESALARVPGVTAVAVNQITHRASITWNAGDTGLAALQAALRHVGLNAQPATATARFEARRRARRRALIELGVAALGMMQVMMFTVPLYFFDLDDVSPEARRLMGWAGMVLTLPVLLFSARTFFIGAWRDLQLRRISMDLPITLAIVATFATSTLSLLAGGNDLYFDSIAMFVFLLLAARYLESSARESSLQMIERLTNAAPAVAARMAGYPDARTAATVAAADLRAGDVIRVATGEVVAADGVIVEGAGEFDESLLTGESRPVARAVRAAVVGGSLNLGAPVLLRVTRAGEATAAAGLRRLTEQALAARPHLGSVADRVARWIAPVTVLLALASALVWWWIDPVKSFPVAVAVLAVTCPCALALAAPAAQALATTRLAREGLLVTRVGALEKIAAASDIVFDKTGTVTEGALRIERVQVLGNRSEAAIVAMCQALEAGSPHPIARALATLPPHPDQPPLVPIARALHVESGAGVSGEIDDVALRLGKRAFVEALVGRALPAGADPGATLYLGCSGRWLGAIVIGDAVKADAAGTIGALREDGLLPHLLSGDRQDRVAAVGASLGFAADAIRAEQTPQQKLAYAGTLRARNRVWIAVGDGVNDAPVMGAASVSIAIGTGADLTRLTADAVLLSPHLAPLQTARHISRRMQRIIRQNLAWAVAYNVVAVPLAVAGLVSPAWAALGMAGSSLAVVLNSLRLMHRRAG